MLLTLKKIAYPVAAVFFLLACSVTLVMIRNTYNNEQLIGEAEISKEKPIIINKEKETPIDDTNRPSKINEEVSSDKKAKQTQVIIEVAEKTHQNRNTDPNSLKEDSYMANETSSGDLTHSPPPVIEHVISEDEELEMEFIEEDVTGNILFKNKDANQRAEIAFFAKEEEGRNEFQEQSKQAKGMDVEEEKRSMKGKKTAMEEQVVFSAIEIMPQFSGGDDALKKFVRDHLRYPKRATDKNLPLYGTVTLKFTVGEKGDIYNIKILKSIGDAYDQEAVRIINKMPKWIPGQRYNEPIAASYVMNIKFFPDSVMHPDLLEFDKQNNQ
jgi:TonB family protein